MQWFKVPPKIYFENDSIQYLEKMEDISRAFIVTDPTMVKLGYVDKILYYLRKREQYCHSEIYSDVEPDPDVETIMRGVEAMRAFQPDVIIALGGGSAIDAITMIKKHGGRNIKFMCIIAAPEGVKALHEAHPDVQIYIGHLDRCLNEHAYICPGLGDAGDRIFGTK